MHCAHFFKPNGLLREGLCQDKIKSINVISLSA